METWVSDWAAARGVISLKLALRYDAAWPDRLFLIPGGRPLFIEFKREGDDLRVLQEHRRATLKTLSYDVESHDTREGAVRAILAAVEASRRAKARR